jgi:hypothetical protein
MESILDIFNPQVSKSGDTISVTYCHGLYSGHCIYKEATLHGNKLKQRIHILTHTDMEDVIECLYKMGEITGPQDLQTISYLIQAHSRAQLEK